MCIACTFRFTWVFGGMRRVVVEEEDVVDVVESGQAIVRSMLGEINPRGICGTGP